MPAPSKEERPETLKVRLDWMPVSPHEGVAEGTMGTVKLIW